MVSGSLPMLRRQNGTTMNRIRRFSCLILFGITTSLASHEYDWHKAALGRHPMKLLLWLLIAAALAAVVLSHLRKPKRWSVVLGIVVASVVIEYGWNILGKIEVGGIIVLAGAVIVLSGFAYGNMHIGKPSRVYPKFQAGYSKFNGWTSRQGERLVHFGRGQAQGS